eukprot:TRINITY_DN13880_c0_g1_i1.p1 TRINITY_DN13880_c0_g1~~TRINITY_DN13880_c0_g1_i1.p1  ORF type:complete len:841 (-),score=178.98 TRINITY_DN13880_c0_g1_i1:36-2558(-)
MQVPDSDLPRLVALVSGDNCKTETQTVLALAELRVRPRPDGDVNHVLIRTVLTNLMRFKHSQEVVIGVCETLLVIATEGEEFGVITSLGTIPIISEHLASIAAKDATECNHGSKSEHVSNKKSPFHCLCLVLAKLFQFIGSNAALIANPGVEKLLEVIQRHPDNCHVVCSAFAPLIECARRADAATRAKVIQMCTDIFTRYAGDAAKATCCTLIARWICKALAYCYREAPVQASALLMRVLEHAMVSPVAIDRIWTTVFTIKEQERAQLLPTMFAFLSNHLTCYTALSSSLHACFERAREDVQLAHVAEQGGLELILLILRQHVADLAKSNVVVERVSSKFDALELHTLNVSDREVLFSSTVSVLERLVREERTRQLWNTLDTDRVLLQLLHLLPSAAVLSAEMRKLLEAITHTEVHRLPHENRNRDAILLLRRMLRNIVDQPVSQMDVELAASAAPQLDDACLYYELQEQCNMTPDDYTNAKLICRTIHMLALGGRSHVSKQDEKQILADSSDGLMSIFTLCRNLIRNGGPSMEAAAALLLNIDVADSSEVVCVQVLLEHLKFRTSKGGVSLFDYLFGNVQTSPDDPSLLFAISPTANPVKRSGSTATDTRSSKYRVFDYFPSLQHWQATAKPAYKFPRLYLQSPPPQAQQLPPAQPQAAQPKPPMQVQPQQVHSSDPFAELPEELVVEILTLAGTFATASEFRLVCRRWASLLRTDESFWQRIAVRDITGLDQRRITPYNWFSFLHRPVVVGLFDKAGQALWYQVPPSTPFRQVMDLIKPICPAESPVCVGRSTAAAAVSNTEYGNAVISFVNVVNCRALILTVGCHFDGQTIAKLCV